MQEIVNQRQTYHMHALLLDETLHSTSWDTAMRVVVSSVGAANAHVLVVLNGVHRESLDDFVLILALLIEPCDVREVRF